MEDPFQKSIKLGIQNQVENLVRDPENEGFQSVGFNNFTVNMPPSSMGSSLRTPQGWEAPGTEEGWNSLPPTAELEYLSLLVMIRGESSLEKPKNSV